MEELQRMSICCIDSMTKVTEILSAIEQGDPHAAEQLLPLVYDELRKLAAQKLAQEAPGQTLQATALVHEAYIRLVGPINGRHDAREEQRWDNCGHFFAAAAEAMRRILINRARDRGRLKRGGGWRRLRLDHIDLCLAEPSDELLILNEALDKLAQVDPACAELVKLRFFAGLSLDEAAKTLGVARRTADRYWAFARSWLYAALSKGEESAGDSAET
jgi:RNA polymerase sigma factor (TIGR02999 family)